MGNYRDELAGLNDAQRIALYRLLSARFADETAPVQELVVLYRDGAGEEELAQLRRRVADELPEHERPTRYQAVSALPLSAQGKLDRKMLPALVREADEPAPEPVDGGAEGSQLLPAVVAAFVASLGRSSIGPDTNFFEAGGHSLLVTDCILNIERDTGARIATAAFFRHPTPRALVALLSAQLPPAHDYLIPLSAQQHGLPVFVLSASRLAYALKASRGDWCVYGVQLRWRDDDDVPIVYRDLRDLARRIAAEIRAVVAEGPFVIAGSSFSAMLAYELAGLLDAEGAGPSLLILVEPSPFASFRSRMQRDLELSAGIQYARHLLLFKWLWLNSPLRARSWRRVMQALGGGRRKPPEPTQAGAIRAKSVADEEAYGRERTFALWSGYRVQHHYPGSILLLATEERGWQIEQNWRRHLAGAATHYLNSTHVAVLRDPFMSQVVVPLIERSIGQAIPASGS